MRKVRCKLCDGKWIPKQGTVISFYNYHLEYHRIREPEQAEGEDDPEYFRRLWVFRRQFFEDTHIYE